MMMLMWPVMWDNLGCKMSLSRSCQKFVVYSLFVEFEWGPPLSTLVLINIQIACYFFFRDIKHVCCKSTPVQSRTYRGVIPQPQPVSGVRRQTRPSGETPPTPTSRPYQTEGVDTAHPATIHNTRTGGESHNDTILVWHILVFKRGYDEYCKG